MKKINRPPSLDLGLLFLALALTGIGIIMIYDASISQAIRDFGDKYYFVKEQIKSALVGFTALIFFSKFDYKKLYYFAIPLLLGTLLLLIMVFIPPLGIQAYGAHRWLKLGFLTIQPSEIAKLSITIYLAAWFTNRERGRFFAFLMLLGIVVGLIMLEPDMGTSIIIALTALTLYFLGGAPISHFLFLIPLSTIAGIFLAKIAPYRLQRILTFFDTSQDPLGTSYHIRQILIALGSGGIFGLGIGKSRQKYEYLPESMTDSIFAIIGEEVGFLGASILVLLFMYLIFKGFKIAIQAHNKFGMLLGAGITFYIGFQTLINLGAMVALIPLVGIPLPFISFGGSSLVVVLSSIGILLNISKQKS